MNPTTVAESQVKFRFDPTPVVRQRKGRFPFEPPDPALPWAIEQDGLDILTEFEQGPNGGAALKAYLCPAGVWTIGWGETEGVEPGDTCTKTQADQWLLDDTTRRAKAVRRLCTVPPTPEELSAMVVLTYNIGVEAFRTKSSVLRLHNAGQKVAASRAFDLWNKVRNKSTGKLEENKGLTRRRKVEGALYLKGSDATATPQAVQDESSLSGSPLVKLGTSAVCTGAITSVATLPEVPPAPAAATVDLAAAAATAEKASGLADHAGSLVTHVATGSRAVAGLFGVHPGVLVAVILVAIGAGVIYWRWRQRRDGWV